jgi:hypothetical protein
MDEFCYATLSSNYMGSSDGDDSSQGFGKENTFFTLQSLASDGDKLQYEERVAYITRDVSRSRPPTDVPEEARNVSSVSPKTLGYTRAYGTIAAVCL